MIGGLATLIVFLLWLLEASAYVIVAAVAVVACLVVLMRQGIGRLRDRSTTPLASPKAPSIGSFNQVLDDRPEAVNENPGSYRLELDIVDAAERADTYNFSKRKVYLTRALARRAQLKYDASGYLPSELAANVRQARMIVRMLSELANKRDN